MTDNQKILRRMAEIEGIGLALVGMGTEHNIWHFNNCKWNPLTNWSDCGPLVEKYNPKMRHLGEWWDVRIGSAHENSPDLKRTICLAIVAAHET